ncbi:hypothetical protein A2839_00450 [Candidatus Uhrbacteria bacterium RIFCSPHIGHO2_01_FULL_47_10]|nr:MAG: hypothetical protein A2839_00450 [Candidatus Uhrbacteria bacterium RIFCSPHIGHO2_01_FULL_47_10]
MESNASGQVSRSKAKILTFLKFSGIFNSLHEGGKIMKDKQDMLWVFDMDGTLYSGVDHVWGEIEKEMVRYLHGLGHPVRFDRTEQDLLRVKWQTRQTTIAYIHEFRLDFEEVIEETHLPILGNLVVELRAGAQSIQHLPGKKIVLTNSPESFAHALLKKLGIHHFFDAILGLRTDVFHAKPNALSYQRIAEGHRVVMVEDWEENLVVPHQLGWATVWFPEEDQSHRPFFPEHVHKHITSLEELQAFV